MDTTHYTRVAKEKEMNEIREQHSRAMFVSSMAPQNKYTSDYSQLRCLVCSDKASGLHYGVVSCESCKSFFGRKIKSKAKFTCEEGGNCVMDLYTRRHCPACRLQKCLTVGMKPERVWDDKRLETRKPLVRKARKKKEASPVPVVMNPESTCSSIEDDLYMELTEDQLDIIDTIHQGLENSRKAHKEILTSERLQQVAKGISDFFKMAAKNGPPPLMNLEEMDKNMFCKSEQPENSCLVPDSMKTKLPPLPDVWKTFSSTMPDFQFPNPQSQGPNLSNVEIKQEKLDTDEYPCQFGENSQSQVQGAAALPNFGGGMPPMLPCFDKSELIVFNMAVLGVVIRQTVQFAKTLPEFRYLDYEDQAVLIKAAILEVLMFRMGETFLPEKNCVVDDIVGIEWNLDIMLYSGFFNSAQKTLNFTRSINSFHLSRAEFSLLEAATILSSDRPELKHPNAVELIQQKILLTLQASCKTNHPDDKVLFAKLVVKLAEVRELVQNHIDDLNEFKLPNHESMFPLISEIFNMDEEMYSGMSQNADTS